jgi:hypothetical protein
LPSYTSHDCVWLPSGLSGPGQYLTAFT